MVESIILTLKVNLFDWSFTVYARENDENTAIKKVFCFQIPGAGVLQALLNEDIQAIINYSEYLDVVVPIELFVELHKEILRTSRYPSTLSLQ